MPVSASHLSTERTGTSNGSSAKASAISASASLVMISSFSTSTRPRLVLISSAAKRPAIWLLGARESASAGSVMCSLVPQSSIADDHVLATSTRRLVR